MFHVYMLSSKPQGTLYVGNTDNLVKRVSEHKSRAVRGFTATYGVDRLVWFESHETRESAWGREKQIKEWKRAWKIRLIEETNPGWLDLYHGLTG
jgi:putative endonuclease